MKSGLKYYGYDELREGPSRHLTYCFNTLIMMSFFNMINCRDLTEKLTPLKEMKGSPRSVIIYLLIFVAQITIMVVGGPFMGLATWVSKSANLIKIG